MTTIKTLERKAGGLARGKMSPHEYRRKCLSAIRAAERWHGSINPGKTWIELRNDDFDALEKECAGKMPDRYSAKGFQSELARYPKGFERTLADRVRRNAGRLDDLIIDNLMIVGTGGPDARYCAALESFCLFADLPTKPFPAWTPRTIADVEADLREIATQRQAGEMIEVSIFCFTDQGREVALEIKEKWNANLYRLSTRREAAREF